MTTKKCCLYLKWIVIWIKRWNVLISDDWSIVGAKWLDTISYIAYGRGFIIVSNCWSPTKLHFIIYTKLYRITFCNLSKSKYVFVRLCITWCTFKILIYGATFTGQMFATACTVVLKIFDIRRTLWSSESEQQTLSHCQFGIRWTLNFMPFKDLSRVATVALATGIVWKNKLPIDYRP